MGAQTLTMFKGDTSLVVTVPMAALGASGLNLYTSIWVTAKHSSGDSDANAVFQKTLSTGVAITTAGSSSVNGVLTVTLADTDTSALPDLANGLPLVYDVKGKTAGGAEATLVADLLIVSAHATKAS